jgi:hypothetical protein
VDSLRPRYSRHQLCRGYLLEVPRKVTVPRQKKALGHELRRMAAVKPPPVGASFMPVTIADMGGEVPTGSGGATIHAL